MEENYHIKRDLFLTKLVKYIVTMWYQEFYYTNNCKAGEKIFMVGRKVRFASGIYSASRSFLSLFCRVPLVRKLLSHGRAWKRLTVSSYISFTSSSYPPINISECLLSKNFKWLNSHLVLLGKLNDCRFKDLFNTIISTQWSIGFLI